MRPTAIEDWWQYEESVRLGAKVSRALADGHQRPGYTLEHAIADVAKTEGAKPNVVRKAYAVFSDEQPSRGDLDRVE
jgi:hypothetical protein